MGCDLPIRQIRCILQSDMTLKVYKRRKASAQTVDQEKQEQFNAIFDSWVDPLGQQTCDGFEERGTVQFLNLRSS
ncbi:hypothetical protein OROMI_014341 [Orobanche minor]